jgi:Zn-finger nucleic acid-binding protein
MRCPRDGSSLLPGPEKASGSWQPTTFYCSKCSGLWLAIHDVPAHAEVADRNIPARRKIDPGRPRSLQGLSLDVLLSRAALGCANDATQMWRLQVRHRGSDFVAIGFEVCTRCHGVWWAREDQDEEFGSSGLDTPEVEAVAMGPLPEVIANLVLELLGGALHPDFHVFSESWWKGRVADAQRQLSSGRRPYRPSELRQEFGDLYDRIVQILWEADPIGLDFDDPGHPSDEYAPEARTILPRLSECQGPDDVQRVAHEEFVRWFDPDSAGPLARYRQIAEELWSEYRRHVKNRRLH